MYNSSASTSSAKGKLRLTMLGNIITIGVPFAAIVILTSILADEFLGRGAGSVAELLCWLILAIVLLARENAKLRATVKGLRK